MLVRTALRLAEILPVAQEAPVVLRVEVPAVAVAVGVEEINDSCRLPAICGKYGSFSVLPIAFLRHSVYLERD
jgi:hypothetical protein